MAVPMRSASRLVPPGWVAGSVLHLWAGRIADPVTRLRFLRRSTLLIEERRTQAKRALVVVAVVLALVLMPTSSIITATSLLRQHAVPPPERPSLQAQGKPSRIWLVEKKDDFEVYSNGLRIETKGEQYHSKRHLRAYAWRSPDRGKPDHPLVVTEPNRPVGIVFHTTESDIAPFEESHNRRLQILARGVLGYVRGIKAYHYLIDRFGRVYRVVSEESIANHAGHSVWGDSRRLYVNLNESFLGVSFEAQTRPQDGFETISQAQQHSGRILTDMLRAKYDIAVENCVTHAQVSVNPDNYGVGAHTDWAVGFPFSAMGLPDNYAIPLPSLTQFGFTYDISYVQLSEARLWKGLLLGQEEQRQAANVAGIRLSEYRSELRRRYSGIYQSIKNQQTREDQE
jgi:hypothetical protein